MVTSTSVAASGGSLHLDNGKATGNMVCYHGRVKTRMNIHTNTSADKRDDATSGTPYDIPEDDPANASTDAHAHGNASTPEPPRARRRGRGESRLRSRRWPCWRSWERRRSSCTRATTTGPTTPPGAASTSATMAPVEQGPNYLAFGDPAASMGIVFYPGAKVEYTAYDPLMRDLAKRGHFVVVVEMPFNFAFFNINAADGIRAAYPQMEYWWVGGHSPGGSMAAQYAANHADDPVACGPGAFGRVFRKRPFRIQLGGHHSLW